MKNFSYLVMDDPVVLLELVGGTVHLGVPLLPLAPEGNHPLQILVEDVPGLAGGEGAQLFEQEVGRLLVLAAGLDGRRIVQERLARQKLVLVVDRRVNHLKKKS